MPHQTRGGADADQEQNRPCRKQKAKEPQQDFHREIAPFRQAPRPADRPAATGNSSVAALASSRQDPSRHRVSSLRFLFKLRPLGHSDGPFARQLPPVRAPATWVVK